MAFPSKLLIINYKSDASAFLTNKAYRSVLLTFFCNEVDKNVLETLFSNASLTYDILAYVKLLLYFFIEYCDDLLELCYCYAWSYFFADFTLEFIHPCLQNRNIHIFLFIVNLFGNSCLLYTISTC